MCSHDLMIVGGQSNGAAVEIAEYIYRPGRRWTMNAVGGKSLAVDWASGSDLRATLINTIVNGGVGKNVAIWWVQGETDCETTAYADAYYANMIALEADVATQTGRNDLIWIDTQLHDDLTLGLSADRDTVRQAKIDFVAATTGAVLLDPNGGSLNDGVHWTASLRVAMVALADAAWAAAFS